MAEDYVLPVRRAILMQIKAWPPLLDLIPAASMWPGTTPALPTFPFTRMGAMMPAPFRASGLDSSAIRFSVQAFSKALYDDDALIATAEDQIYRIGSAIKDALDGQALLLENGLRLRVTWIASSPMRDGAEQGAWMVTCTFMGEVAG